MRTYMECLRHSDPEAYDKAMTNRLRFWLAAEGYVAPEYYEWHNGEPLYHGEPIEPKASPAEQRAVDRTRKEN